MHFNPPMEKGFFIKREKRFFAHIEQEGKPLLAHLPNTGSLTGCLISKQSCLFTPASNPKRKLKYTLQLIKTPHSWVGVNTHLANTLVEEAFFKKQISHWKKWGNLKKEVKINTKTRIDFVFSTQNQYHFVEVKSVTLAQKDQALFPDAITKRGQKHLKELIFLAKQGHSTEIFFLIQRTDCKSFAPAHQIDPVYAKLLKEASEKGVKISAYPFLANAQNIQLNSQSLKILVPPHTNTL